MAENLYIDGVSVRSLGFSIKTVNSGIWVGAPKQQGSAKEDITSENFFLQTFTEKSPEPDFEILGVFTNLIAANSAVYSLYGLLVQIGERTFIHTDGENVISFKGVMSKGAKGKPKKIGNNIYIKLTVKLLKSADG